MTTPASSGSRLELQVDARLAALEPARLRVLDFLAPHALGEQLVYKLELVLEETLMNVISHAHADPRGHHVLLCVDVKPDALVLCFEDDGVAFDPLQAPPPVRPSSIETAEPGGLGLFLVRHVARSVDYQRLPGRNRLTVTLARQCPPAR